MVLTWPWQIEGVANNSGLTMRLTAFQLLWTLCYMKHLDDWGFDGIVIADDICELGVLGGFSAANETRHEKSDYPTPSRQLSG